MRCLGLFFFCAAFCFAESYTYHPSNTLHLGAGFDPAYPERAFQSCLEFDGRASVDGQGAIKTDYSLSLVKSKKELFDRLSISASLSARGLFWSASAGVDYFSQHQFHSDSITWMLMGKSEYGRFIIQNPKLSASATELLKQGKHELFAQQCGTDFVKQERRSVLIAAVFSMENVSVEDIKRLETYFQASFSAGFFEASAQSKYARFISEASRINQIHISVHAIGGSGITELTHLVVHPDDLSEIQKTIEHYMKTLDESRAVPCEYLSGSMTAFGWKGQTPAEVFKKKRVLSDLYYRYEEIHSSYQRLGSILSLKNSSAYADLSDEQWQIYVNQYNQHANYLQNILEAADVCHRSFADCKVPNYVLERIIWPVNFLSECAQIRLQAYQAGLINDQELRKLRQFNMTPLLKKNSQTIAAYAFCGGL